MLVKHLLIHSLLLSGLLTSCQVRKPYAPPPQKVTVQSVEVEVSQFHGRPEAYATVKGFLSTSAAQLVDTKQSRDGHTLYLEVLEQTPRGANLASGLVTSPSFEKRVPLELLGLAPGTYRLVANEVQVLFTIPPLHPDGAGSVPPQASPRYPAATSVEDEGEWIDIEDTDFLEPGR